MQKLHEFKTMEIGKIPEDWVFHHLNEIVKINPETIDREYSFKEIEYIDIGSVENYEVKKCEHFKLFERPSRAQRIVRQNDIIVSTVRPYLHGFAKIRDSKPNIVCSTGFAVLRCNNPVSVEFIFNFIMSQYFESQLNRHMTGLAYPAVTSKIVGDSALAYPKDIEEVKHIGNILSKVNELIQKTNQIIEQTQRLKLGLMRNLLTKGIGHTRFKKTGLGEIPEEWTIFNLENVSDISCGTTPSTFRSGYYNGNIPFIRTSEIINEPVKIGKTFISKKAVDEYRLKLFPIKTIFLAMYGQGKTRGQVGILQIPATTSQNTAAIVTNVRLKPEFLYHYLINNYNKLRNISMHAHISHLNLNIVKKMKIPIPPLNEQTRIAKIINSIESYKFYNLKVNGFYKKLKEGLMQQLLTGKIRVKA